MAIESEEHSVELLRAPLQGEQALALTKKPVLQAVQVEASEQVRQSEEQAVQAMLLTATKKPCAQAVQVLTSVQVVQLTSMVLQGTHEPVSR